VVNYLAMLSIKLIRTGKKNYPSFRVVVIGSGIKIIETLGSYYPHLNPPRLSIVKDRIDYWRKSGARLSSAVDRLLKGKYEFRRYVPVSKESTSVTEGTAVTEGVSEQAITQTQKPVEERKENA